MLRYLSTAAAVFIPYVAQAAVVIESTNEITWLEDGMPASLEIGQTYTIGFTYDENSNATSSTSSSVYFDGAITDFSLSIPEAGFSVTGNSGTTELYQTGGSTFFSLAILADSNAVLDGQEFNGAWLIFPDMNSLFSGLYEAAVLPDQEEIDTVTEDANFSFSFYEPGGSTSLSFSSSNSVSVVSYGSVGVIVPEPSALGYALAGLLLIVLRHRR
ncbi:MAG: hypothetical protein AAGA45_00090 [Verrucomicrobiota bacterium]